jgi:hypothetical protein
MFLRVDSWGTQSNTRGLLDYFRQSEIENLGMSSLRDEDICGFDVAVDDASSVSGVERVCDLDAEIERCLCQAASLRFDASASCRPEIP